jgi:hypothetical protein
MRDRAKDYQATCFGFYFMTIQEEIARGVHVLNSENNKKFTKDANLMKYSSCARTLLR